MGIVHVFYKDADSWNEIYEIDDTPGTSGVTAIGYIFIAKSVQIGPPASSDKLVFDTPREIIIHPASVRRIEREL